VTASSTDRRNTLVKSFRRGLETQRLARTLVQLARHGIQLRLRVYRQVGPFGKILSQQTIGVLVGTPLPRALRVAEVHLDVSRQGEASQLRH
jgi:hypothetical protein